MNISIRALLIDGWDLLTRRQRVLGAAIAALLFIAGTIELAALSSAVPLVSLIVAPETVNTLPILALLSSWLGSPPVDTLILWLGIGVAIFLVIGVAANLLAQYLAIWFGARVATRLAQELFSQCVNAPYHWFLSQDGPKIAQRLTTDPSSVGTILYPAILELSYATIIVVLGAAIVAVALPGQSLVAIAVIAAIAVVVLGLIKPRVIRYSADTREHSIECTRVGVDTVSGIKDVIVKFRQAYFQKAHHQAFDGMVRSRTKLALLQMSAPIIILLVGQLGLVSVALAMHAADVDTAQMSTLMALLVLIVARLLPAVSRFFTAVNKIANAVPFVHGYQALRRDLAQASAQLTNPAGLPPAPNKWQTLQFQSVSFAYPDTTEKAVRNVTLTLQHGKAYGLIGRSGAGKTTLVDLLLGLFRPQTGEILLDGQPIDGFAPTSWLRHIGYVPQSPFMVNDTLRRNVALGVHDDLVDEARVIESLAAAGLSSVVARLEQGLETPIGDRGTRLSGGQVQRIAIARALYGNPDLLILDEATSALDSLTELELKETIADLRGKMTVVTVAHRHSTIEDCDTVFVLENGRLVDHGSFAELRSRDNTGLDTRDTPRIKATTA